MNVNKEKINKIYRILLEDDIVDIANKHCNGGYPNPVDCAWYHGNWMLFRYLGLVSNPYWHEVFYMKALTNIVGSSDKKVLVAGTADFSMPLLCQEVGVSNISVCDICDTPLIICKKASDLLNAYWNVFNQDVTVVSDTHYDVIVNDAFLSRFQEKQDVLTGISNLLLDEGYYITTLKKGSVNRGGEVSQELKERFLNKARERYLSNIDVLPQVDIDDAITTYVDRMSSYPIDSADSIINMFSSSNLKVVSLETGDVEGEYEASTYYRIIAKKINRL